MQRLFCDKSRYYADLLYDLSFVGFDGTTNGLDEFPRFVSQDGVEMTPVRNVYLMNFSEL